VSIRTLGDLWDLLGGLDMFQSFQSARVLTGFVSPRTRATASSAQNALSLTSSPMDDG
jgi:hypothetical protein